MPYPKRDFCKRGHDKRLVGAVGKFGACKACQKQKCSEWQKGHRQRTAEKRAAKLEQAAGRLKPAACEICGGSGRICFDHDHTTGKFRGWLCSHCNSILGLVDESAERLLKLALYLEQHHAER
jgi:hypothetical protein